MRSLARTSSRPGNSGSRSHTKTFAVLMGGFCSRFKRLSRSNAVSRFKRRGRLSSRLSKNSLQVIVLPLVAEEPRGFVGDSGIPPLCGGPNWANIGSCFAHFISSSLLDFHNKVTTSETLISDYKVRSQVRNNVKSRLIMVYYLYWTNSSIKSPW